MIFIVFLFHLRICVNTVARLSCWSPPSIRHFARSMQLSILSLWFGVYNVCRCRPAFIITPLIWRFGYPIKLFDKVYLTISFLFPNVRYCLHVLCIFVMHRFCLPDGNSRWWREASQLYDILHVSPFAIVTQTAINRILLSRFGYFVSSLDGYVFVDIVFTSITLRILWLRRCTLHSCTARSFAICIAAIFVFLPSRCMVSHCLFFPSFLCYVVLPSVFRILPDLFSALLSIISFCSVSCVVCCWYCALNPVQWSVPAPMLRGRLEQYDM